MVFIGITCSFNRAAGFFRLGKDYVSSVEKAGGVPLPIICREKKSLDAVISAICGLLLSGGGDIDPCYYGEEPAPGLGEICPERDELEIELARRALKRGIPVLGICRGAQVLSVAAGGSIYQDLGKIGNKPLEHRQKAPRDHPYHEVKVEEGTLLWRILGERKKIRVNSFHHQSIKDPGRGFIVSAFAPDGVVEGVESSLHPFAVGVQWHPENLAAGGKPGGQELFDALLQAATIFDTNSP